MGLILCRGQGGGECGAWYNAGRKDNEANTVSCEPNGPLPQVEDVFVPKIKVVAYLLNPLHPKGASKAKFFTGGGFSRERLEELATALRQHARNCPVVYVEKTEHGTLYVVEGVLHTPNGKRPLVRSVWLKDTEAPPRLVTAYPIGGHKR